MEEFDNQSLFNLHRSIIEERMDFLYKGNITADVVNVLLEIVKKLEKVIGDFQPNIIYTHHFGDLNIDHQITHKAVMTACRPQPNFCVKEIYSFETLSATHWQSSSMGNAFSPNCFIDVSDLVDIKMKALQCYDSEMRATPHVRSYKSVEILSKLRGNLVGVENAEAFFLERLVK